MNVTHSTDARETVAVRPLAVLFDLDGVLFDTEPLHRRAWLRTMHSLGHAISEESLLEWTGIPCIDLAEHYERTITPERSRELYHDRKGAAFREIVREELAPFTGVTELILRISERARVGFATSNHRVDAELMLSVSGLAELLSIGVTYEDVSRHKPDPEPYLLAASRLGIAPEACVVIEDSPSGVKAAISAGMVVAGVTSTFASTELLSATRVFPGTVEAGAWVESLLS